MAFLGELSSGKVQIENFVKFKLLVSILLESQAPIEEKYITSNQAPLIKLERKTQFSINQRLNYRLIFVLNFLGRQKGTSTITAA